MARPASSVKVSTVLKPAPAAPKAGVQGVPRMRIRLVATCTRLQATPIASGVRVSPLAWSAAIAAEPRNSRGEPASVHARYERAACTVAGEASGTARPMVATMAGAAAVTSSPAPTA